MSNTPSGIWQMMDGLEMMARNATGYRESLCILEVGIELNGWFGNDYTIHEKLNRIEEAIIPRITRQPRDLDRDSWELAKEIKEQHREMSIYAAESVVEYWQEHGEKELIV